MDGLRVVVALGAACVMSLAVTKLIKAQKKPVSEPILSEKGRRAVETMWNLPTITLKGLKFSENRTYLVQCERGRFVLRITPKNHRTKSAISAELQYIAMMARSVRQDIVRICSPVPLSKTEDYLGEFSPYEDSEEWFAVLFEHANGIGAEENWMGLTNDDIIEAWGLALGEMHNAIIARCGDLVKWNETQQALPTLYETHRGTLGLKLIEERAKTGHPTYQKLSSMHQSHIVPFLKTFGDPNQSPFFAAIHGDLNLSNYLAERRPNAKTRLWVFDFDQMHVNWLGADLGVVLQWTEFSRNLGWISADNQKKFREIFVAAYTKTCPAMVKAGHTTESALNGFIQYCEWWHTAICAEVMWQVDEGKHWHQDIVWISNLIVKHFYETYDKLN